MTATGEPTEWQSQELNNYFEAINAAEMDNCRLSDLSPTFFDSQQVAIDYDNESQQFCIDQKIPIHQIGILQQPFAGPILGNDEFAGDLNFGLILNHQNSGKHWVYSEKLSKVFIHMEEVLPLQFSWNPMIDGLWIRATVVYKLDSHRSTPVTRCHNHMAPDNISNVNLDAKSVKHVIRCLHSASIYEEATNGHLSVLTPLGTPEPGGMAVPMHFKFFCKNSCTSGMNRRPTEVIFTLETQQSQVIGRRKLEIRVCSCPKRDKEKEENESDPKVKVTSGKKRKLVQSAPALPPPPPPGKKFANSDTKVYELNLNVVGKDNYNAIIKYAHDVMAGSALRSGHIELYKPYMDEVMRKSQ